MLVSNKCKNWLDNNPRQDFSQLIPKQKVVRFNLTEKVTKSSFCKLSFGKYHFVKLHIRLSQFARRVHLCKTEREVLLRRKFHITKCYCISRKWLFTRYFVAKCMATSQKYISHKICIWCFKKWSAPFFWKKKMTIESKSSIFSHAAFNTFQSSRFTKKTCPTKNNFASTRLSWQRLSKDPVVLLHKVLPAEYKGAVSRSFSVTLKGQKHIYINENLKIMLQFCLTLLYTSTMELSVSPDGNGFFRWKNRLNLMTIYSLFAESFDIDIDIDEFEKV